MTKLCIQGLSVGNVVLNSCMTIHVIIIFSRGGYCLFLVLFCLFWLSRGGGYAKHEMGASPPIIGNCLVLLGLRSEGNKKFIVTAVREYTVMHGVWEYTGGWSWRGLSASGFGGVSASLTPRGLLRQLVYTMELNLRPRGLREMFLSVGGSAYAGSSSRIVEATEPQ